ncbi:protein disks lost [Malaya genurostris]|uniref:protein disks lost n=1 Tax=Malaya genurostris TaxID=325434 RepID=UPI0026F3FBA1|nr:protein disks lost [Malaya genurostris]XP_058447022.1 protein disks lost [Malaya genurostris]XP_058447023.1 protein disks lost [Malaya genurostris]
MAQEILEKVLAVKLEAGEQFPAWFLAIFECEPRSCSIEDFAVHFLGLIRTQTEDFTKCVPSMCDTPKKVLPVAVANSGRKLSITSSASSDPPANSNNNPPVSVSATTGPSIGAPATDRLPTTSGRLKEDTSGIKEQLDASGSRPQSARSISRDLFAGARAVEEEQDEDFHTGFRKIDGIQKSFPAVGPPPSVTGTEDASKRRRADQVSMTPPIVSTERHHSYERNENEKHPFPVITEEALFSPIPNARIGTPTTIGKTDGGTNSSTPIRNHGAKPITHQLNTSTPIVSLSNRSGKGSRNSWNLDCSTPNNNQSAPGNGTRHDSRRCHDRSFGNYNHHTSSNSSASRPTSSPCLGDFITHSSLKSKPRKSVTNAAAPGSANNSKDSSSKPNSLFMENEFPGLKASMQPSTPGSEQQRSKKRVTPITVSKTLTSRLGGSSFELDNSISPAEGKSKRRVTPTTILTRSTGLNRHDFTSSSFKSDNNLINLTEDSLELDLSQKDERGLLRNYKDIIRSSFEAAEEQNPDTNRMLHTALRNSIITPRKLAEGLANAQPVRIELNRVTLPVLINRLVDVYTVLIDLNLTPNVLSEVSYLINLINTEFDPLVCSPPDTAEDCGLDKPAVQVLSVLKNLNNCVYFAMEALNRQKNLLALLDSTTLKVLIENERIATLNQPLNDFLKDCYAQKLQLDCSGQKILDGTMHVANSGSGINVFYQQEADTREHFPSDREFGAFKKQRDMFCTIYRTWDLKHLNPTWNFLAELGTKVRSLSAIMDHPINMAHLAKLFTAQLVQSCNFDNAASELAMDLPNVDPAKLVKLRQRLVAPSQFSTQYLFPGSQAFFRDFIIASETNQIFIEQLKAGLIHELLEMNGSSYEVLNVSVSENQHDSEYVVRPESTTTMRVLAKFIGYIISRPFNFDSCRNTTVENRQIELRNVLLPLFDVKSILLRAIAERKLIITVPWLVQYLAMLDGITLRLSYYRELFDVLYELYLRTTAYDGRTERRLLATPTSKFIIRACLGWLFEHPNIPEEYYSYRQERRSLLSTDEGLHNYKKITVLVDNGISEDLETSPLILTKIDGRSQGTMSCEMRPLRKQISESGFLKNDLIAPKVSLNPLLESILNAACPFLADFRVSMMPSKLEKTVSRSGRYRHITTKYSGATTVVGSSQKPTTNDQHKLLEAFLRSQSLSVRRTVEFVIERTSSAAIKDFQITHLLPRRKQTSEQIAALQTESISHATKEIYVICSAALAEINASWDSHVPPMLARRIQEAFDALLPSETLEPVKRTCINLALERCLVKINEWRQTHMFEIDLFCKDIPSEAAKVVKEATSKQNFVLSNLTVKLEQTPHTVVYDRLQTMIYLAASLPDELDPIEVKGFIALTTRYLDEQDGTPAMNKTLAFMMLQLALLIVINRCDLIVPDLVQSLLSVWKHGKLKEFCTIPSTADDDNEEDEIEKLIINNTLEDGERPMVDEEDIRRIRLRKQQSESNYIFSTLVSNRCIRMMAHRDTDQVFACFASFINSMVDCNLINIRRLNEQFVKIFNEDWHQRTLERVSLLMDAVLRGTARTTGAHTAAEEGTTVDGLDAVRAIRRKTNNVDDSHSQLFLEMLSDLAREIEDF